jgi:exoribonuclease-2
MGVAHYTWATSPLRRYVDLVNQWQIIACARHGRTAALVAPFKPRDAQLFAVISGFEAAYSAYNGFQNAIERYWTLRWLQQHEVTEFEAHVMKDGLVRATELPLVLRVGGTESLPRGALVRLRLTGVDLLTLDAYANLLARVDEPVTTDDLAQVDDSADDDEAPATGLALAIEVDDTDTGASSDIAPADAAPATAPL